MKRILLAATLSILALNAPYAQDAGPAAEEPPAAADALRLPDTESEVRSVLPSSVEAPLPPLPPVPLPVTVPPLPAAGELAVPESAYKIQGAPEDAGESERGEILVDAELGAGLWSAVTAKFSLYRPGPVSYALGFAHEGADGFAFREAGEGYLLRRSSVNGRADGSTPGGADWSVSAAFSDESDGLQGQSEDFSAVSHRYLNGGAAWKRPAGAFGLRASLDSSLSTRALERAAVSGDGAVRELEFAPRAGVEWERGKLVLALEGTYGFRSLYTAADLLDDPYQSIRADLSATYERSAALVLGASVGAVSTSNFAFLAPFSLRAEAGLGDYAAVAVSGGMAAEGASLAAAWKENPYLDAGEPLGDDAQWFVGSRLDLFGPRRLSLRFGADWASSLAGGGRLVPVAPAAGSTRALYAYAFEEYETFTTTASVRKRFGAVAATGAGAVAGLGWTADWIDGPAYGEAQRLVLDLEYRGADEVYGGRIDASVGFAPDDFEVPVVDLSGFIRFARSARFVLDLRDVLAAFALSDGRERYDPYLSAGFRADARIQISL